MAGEHGEEGAPGAVGRALAAGRQVHFARKEGLEFGPDARASADRAPLRVSTRRCTGGLGLASQSRPTDSRRRLPLRLAPGPLSLRRVAHVNQNLRLAMETASQTKLDITEYHQIFEYLAIGRT